MGPIATTRTKKTLALALAAGSFAVAGCGGGDDEPAASAPGQGNGTDRAFVAEMIPHHRSAVDMAQIARKRGESEFVRDLADDIIRTQNTEIATMQREDRALETAGIKRGSLPVPDHMKGMDDDPATLRDAKPFDKAFLEMMIPHHAGALTMAEAELEDGADPELKMLAQQIITAQAREIRDMREHLGGGGGDAHGDGH